MTVTVIGHVLDYSTARPSAAAIKASGYAGVIRYLSVAPNPKIIEDSERAAFEAAGLAYALVWETTAGRAAAGAGAGATDGARAAAAAPWWPADRPIYAAVDYQAVGAQITAAVDYVLAFAHTSGHPAGVYGSYYVVEAAAGRGVPYRWQTLAWSDGKISPRIQLLQTSGGTAFPDTDLNLVYAPDWGQNESHVMDLTPQNLADIAHAVANYTDTGVLGTYSLASYMGIAAAEATKAANALAGITPGGSVDLAALRQIVHEEVAAVLKSVQ